MDYFIYHLETDLEIALVCNVILTQGRAQFTVLPGFYLNDTSIVTSLNTIEVSSKGRQNQEVECRLRLRPLNLKLKDLFFLKGMRLGKLMAKIGISAILAKYSFELVDKKLYKNDLKLKTREVSTSAAGNVDIRVKLRVK